MGRVYSPEFRAQALAQLELNAGALRATAREVGVAAPVLMRWRDGAPGAAYSQVLHSVTLIPAKTTEPTDFVALLGQRFRQALDLLAERLPIMEPRDLAIATGILSDKLLDHRDGRRGTNVNIDARSQHLALPASLTIEELKALAAGGVEPGAR